MENNEIKIKKNKLIEAYKNGNIDQKNVLEYLYGIEMFRPKSIMDRVKTFDDAVNVLGERNSLVIEFRKSTIYNTDLLAFLKLRIITTALNERWKPKFTQDQYRYYLCFFFYTKEQYDKMGKGQRDNLISFGMDAGIVYASLDILVAYGPVNTSRFYFKTRELAEYAAKQFIDVFYDFYRK